MTNKHIEDAVKRFEKKFSQGLYGVLWNPDNSFRYCWLETPQVQDFLRTELQAYGDIRYEAGRESMLKEAVEALTTDDDCETCHNIRERLSRLHSKEGEKGCWCKCPGGWDVEACSCKCHSPNKGESKKTV